MSNCFFLTYISPDFFQPLELTKIQLFSSFLKICFLISELFQTRWVLRSRRPRQHERVFLMRNVLKQLLYIVEQQQSILRQLLIFKTFFPFQIAERCGEDYSQNRPADYDSAKRFCEPNTVRSVTSSTNGSRTLPYSHSMPTSPTMFERGNEARSVLL